MIRRLVLLPRALLDVADIFQYFRAIDPRLAARFYDAFDATLPLIERAPQSRARLVIEGCEHLDYRCRRPKGFENYLIFYRITETAVEIVRVLHGSRDLESALRDV